MDRQVLTMLIREGTQLVSQFLRFRSVGIAERDPLQAMQNKSDELDDKAAELIKASGPENAPPVNIPAKTVSSPEAPSPIASETPEINEATAVPTGCIPCALGHYGACTGILNEAVRFARDDGMASNEVLDRVGMCLDELNAMERKDLRPQMIIQLPAWEKELAEKALSESRAIRHQLEGLTTSEQLEVVAGGVQQTRQELYRTWAKRRLKNMTPEEKTEMTERILTRLEQEE